MASPDDEFIAELKSEFGQFNFIPSTRFKWKAPNSIFYEAKTDYSFEDFALLTLHELGHALSNHKDYKTDVERLKMESEAWQRAKQLIKEHPAWQDRYRLFYNKNLAETELDSYRDWLHQKSKCKKCGLTRYQTTDGVYHCPNCEL